MLKNKVGNTMLINTRVIGSSEMRKVTVFMKQFEQVTNFVKVDIDHATKMYERGIENGSMTVLVMEKDEILIGSMAFIIAPDLHENKLVGVETYWFMHPDHRKYGLKLFDMFEQLAIKQGCEKLAMIHMIDSYPISLEKLYKRRGYELIEKHYVKEVVK